MGKTWTSHFLFRTITKTYPFKNFITERGGRGRGCNYALLFSKEVLCESTKILKWIVLAFKLLVIINSILDVWQGSKSASRPIRLGTGLGKVNQFFQKLIHPCTKNVYCSISHFYWGYRATAESEKKFIICNYFQIWLFPFFWLYSLFPSIINENCELYSHE